MTCANTYLTSIGYALGARKQTIWEAQSNQQLLSSAQVLVDAGFASHFVCPAQQTSYDLARMAVDKIVTDMCPEVGDIDAILYANCLPQNANLGDREAFERSKDVKALMDFPVSHLQHDFGFDKAFLMGVNQSACTSLLGSIRLARAFLMSEPALHNVICITADRFPTGAYYEQGYNLISDGAAGCLVTKDPGPFKIIDCHQISNGAMAQANDDETAGFYFTYTHRLITESLARCNKTIQDLAWIVPQNTNVKAWMILSQLLGFAIERVLMPTRSEIGHCISGDNLINLAVSATSNQIQVGDLIAMPMAGFGLNWSCLMLERVADNV